jgi:hypothetical protein
LFCTPVLPGRRTHAAFRPPQISKNDFLVHFALGWNRTPLYWEELNKERVESFLYNLPLYREALTKYPRQGNKALLEKLDTLIADYDSA